MPPQQPTYGIERREPTPATADLINWTRSHLETLIRETPGLTTEEIAEHAPLVLTRDDVRHHLEELEAAGRIRSTSDPMVPTVGGDPMIRYLRRWYPWTSPVTRQIVYGFAGAPVGVTPPPATQRSPSSAFDTAAIVDEIEGSYGFVEHHAPYPTAWEHLLAVDGL